MRRTLLPSHSLRDLRQDSEARSWILALGHSCFCRWLNEIRHGDLKQFDWIEIAALPANSKMEMWAGGAARGSAECEDLTSSYLCTDRHLDLREVHVDTHQTESVVDNYATSFVVERLCENDAAGGDGYYRRARLRPIIQSAMDAVEL